MSHCFLKDRLPNSKFNIYSVDGIDLLLVGLKKERINFSSKEKLQAKNISNKFRTQPWWIIPIK